MSPADYFSPLLTGVGVLTILLNVVGKISDRTYYAVYSLVLTGQILYGIFVHESPVLMYILAAYTGYFAYKWWTGGGGDNTKRRLRKLKRKFQGVRRTAPATA